MRVYGYLRASTEEQDALRAKEVLQQFAQGHKIKISGYYMENESGTKLERKELFALIDRAEPGDIMLIEQVDRLTRLKPEDWDKLKTIINNKGISIVSIDLSTSHMFLNQNKENVSFAGEIIKSVNAMLLDCLATVSRKDYEDRRRRQKEGIAKAKKEHKYKGRQENKTLLSNVEAHLLSGKSYNDIQKLLKCSRHTIAKVSKRIKEAQKLE